MREEGKEMWWEKEKGYPIGKHLLLHVCFYCLLFLTPFIAFIVRDYLLQILLGNMPLLFFSIDSEGLLTSFKVSLDCWADKIQ